MSEFCIRKSTFNKIHSFAFLLALTQLLINIVNIIYPKDTKNQILESYSKSLGEAFFIFIPYIKLFPLSDEKEKLDQKEKSKCECSKNNILIYFILLFTYAVYVIFIFVCSFISGDEINNKGKSIFELITKYLSTKEGIEIISLTITIRFLLKANIYLHHYLSIFFFFLSCLGIDLITGNYPFLAKKTILENLLNFIMILTEVLCLCYIKYMLFRKYYYWKIMSSFGFTSIIINSIILLYIILTPKKEAPNFVNNFLEYFDKVSVGIIVSKFFINLILQFIHSIFEILTILYLSPEFILIAQISSKIFFILLNGNDNKYICIIFFILQFLSLMIYLEILELNFCNLNKDTKRSIRSFSPYGCDYFENREKIDDDKGIEIDDYIL